MPSYSATMTCMDDEYAEAVLQIVESIPPGRVMTYGAIADVVGASLGRGGPRQVGSVMSHDGGGVPWWRVVRADGRGARGHEIRARELWLAEVTPLHPDGDRVDLRRAAWSPEHAG